METGEACDVRRAVRPCMPSKSASTLIKVHVLYTFGQSRADQCKSVRPPSAFICLLTRPGRLKSLGTQRPSFLPAPTR